MIKTSKYIINPHLPLPHVERYVAIDEVVVVPLAVAVVVLVCREVSVVLRWAVPFPRLCPSVRGSSSRIDIVRTR